MVDKRKFAIAARQMGSATQDRKRDLLRDEYNILRQLDHDNVVRVFDAFEDDRTLFIVMEYVKGGELFDFIVDNGCFEEGAARSIFRQMLEAVNWLHARGISHRDLKPENILLQPKGSAYDAAPEQTTVDGWKVKISDFGECAPPRLRTQRPHAYPPSPAGMSRLVSKGSFMKTLAGTPHYLGAPDTTRVLLPPTRADTRSRQRRRSSLSRARTGRATTTVWTCGRSASSCTPCAVGACAALPGGGVDLLPPHRPFPTGRQPERYDALLRRVPLPPCVRAGQAGVVFLPRGVLGRGVRRRWVPSLPSQCGEGAWPPPTDARRCTAKDLIRKLLRVDPSDRLTAEEALKHPWMLEGLSVDELPARVTASDRAGTQVIEEEEEDGMGSAAAPRRSTRKRSRPADSGT